MAGQLAAEGHQVYALAERPGRGRTADLLVCGIPVEVKSWLSRDQGRGHAPGIRSVVNKLLQAEGQAATVVLDRPGQRPYFGGSARWHGDVRRSPHRGHVAAVRVLGDGFDLAWARVRVLELHRRLEDTGRLAAFPAPPSRTGPGAVDRRIRASLREAALCDRAGWLL